MKYLICLSLILSACVSKQPQAPEPAPVAPIQYPVKGWFYDDVVAANLTPAMLKYGDVARWQKFIKSVAYYESSYDRTNFYVESGIRDKDGKATIDRITGNPMVSQGLLQLSYVDQLNYAKATRCSSFDWSKDKGKPRGDPSLTINNAENNLICGLQIMSYRLRNGGNIKIALGAYWSVIAKGKAVF